MVCGVVVYLHMYIGLSRLGYGEQWPAIDEVTYG